MESKFGVKILYIIKWKISYDNYYHSNNKLELHIYRPNLDIASLNPENTYNFEYKIEYGLLLTL